MMKPLSEQQVRYWMDSIFRMEGPEDGEHSVSPVARAVTLALVDVPYVPTYMSLERLHQHTAANKYLCEFRAFLDEVVRVMDNCGVRPWTNADGKGQVSP